MSAFQTYEIVLQCDINRYYACFVSIIISLKFKLQWSQVFVVVFNIVHYDVVILLHIQIVVFIKSKKIILWLLYAIKHCFLIPGFLNTIIAFFVHYIVKGNLLLVLILLRGFSEKGNGFWKTFCVGNLIQTISLGGLLIFTQLYRTIWINLNTQTNIYDRKIDN